jgi:hypothetical protein
MREVDPIRNPSDALLSSALHRLASGSPQNAPAELGAELAREFRRRHARRRQVRLAVVASLAACLALAAALLAWRSPAHHKVQPQIAQQEIPAAATAEAQPQQQAATQQRSRPAGQARPAAAASSSADDAFVELDTYDPSLASNQLQVVRLEISGSDLRMIGAPVAEDLSDRRLLADIVVGEDGTPYAVRLVR